MRTLRRNRQKMYYALYTGKTPMYKEDADGNTMYMEVDGEQVPIETGEERDAFSAPVEFYGNITNQGGQMHPEYYGDDYSTFDALLYVRKGTLPIGEDDIIWYESEPEVYDDGTAKKESCDYLVRRKPPVLDEMTYLLQRSTKG